MSWIKSGRLPSMWCALFDGCPRSTTCSQKYSLWDLVPRRHLHNLYDANLKGHILLVTVCCKAVHEIVELMFVVAIYGLVACLSCSWLTWSTCLENKFLELKMDFLRKKRTMIDALGLQSSDALWNVSVSALCGANWWHRMVHRCWRRWMHRCISRVTVASSLLPQPIVKSIMHRRAIKIKRLALQWWTCGNKHHSLLETCLLPFPWTHGIKLAKRMGFEGRRSSAWKASIWYSLSEEDSLSAVFKASDYRHDWTRSSGDALHRDTGPAGTLWMGFVRRAAYVVPDGQPCTG